MADLTRFTEEEKKSLREFPEFANLFSAAPAHEAIAPTPKIPKFSPEERQMLAEFPEFQELSAQFPPPAIPGPRRIVPVSPIPPRTIEELPERGIVGDIGAAVVGGVRDVAEMGLRSARVGLPTESAYEPTGITSKALEELEKTDKWEIMKPSRDVVEGPWYRRWIYEGVRSALPSLTSRIGGGVAGFIGGGIPGAVAGLVAGSGMFGLSEYDRFMEEGRKAGLREEDIKPYAITSGLVEWGGEAVASVIGAKLLGPLGQKTLTDPIKNSIRQMFKKPLKQGAIDLMKTMATEVGTEIAQESTETFLRHRAGLPEEITPFEAGVDAIGPTIVMTSIFGLGAAGMNRAQRNRLYKALSDPNVPEAQRLEAALEITKGLVDQAKSYEETDPETSKQLATMALEWDTASGKAIEDKQKIDIDQTIEEYLSQPRTMPTGEPTSPPTIPGAGEEVVPTEREGMKGIWYEGRNQKTRNLIAKHIEQIEKLGIEADLSETETPARPEAGVKGSKGYYLYVPEGIEFAFDKKGNIIGLKEQAKPPAEEKPPKTTALPPQAKAEPAPEKPRGIIPTEEIWKKTPMDIQNEWMKASEFIDKHRGTLDAQIKTVQGELDALKGKRGKEATQKRKEITEQLKTLKAEREAPRGEYEERSIEESMKLADEARKRALEKGLPEEEVDEFVEEFLMESSTDRPYVEYNYKKTVSQIFDEVFDRFSEERAEPELPKEGIESRKSVEPTEPGGELFENLRSELEAATGEEYSDEAVEAHVEAAGGWETEPKPKAKPKWLSDAERYNELSKKTVDELTPEEKDFVDHYFDKAGMSESDANILRAVIAETPERESLLGRAFHEGIDNLTKEEQNKLFRDLFPNYSPSLLASYIKGWKEIAKVQTGEAEEALAYIGRLKNKLKKEYAEAFHQWLLGDMKGPTPERKGLSAMAAQAVRMEIEKHYPQKVEKYLAEEPTAVTEEKPIPEITFGEHELTPTRGGIVAKKVESEKEPARDAAIGAITGRKVEQVEDAGFEFVWGGSPDQAIGPLTLSHVERLRERGIGVQKTGAKAEKGFAIEVLAEGKWSRNNMVFPTEEMAKQQGDDILSRWMAARDFRVIPVDEAPNYEFVSGKLSRIETKAEAWGEKNKVFTKERADRAREILKKKGGELRTGIDPELIQAGIDLAGYHIEAGARKFADYARMMIQEVGEWVRPYLKSWYNSIRDYPGFDAQGMDSYEDVSKINVDKIGEKPTIATEGETLGREPTQAEGIEGIRPESLEEVPTEAIPRADEVGVVGEETRAGRGEYPEGIQPGEGAPVEEGGERLAGAPVGVGAGEGGIPAPAGREGREPAPGPARRNFRITPEYESRLVTEKGPKTKARNNIEAIRLLKKIEEEARLATPEEQETLSRYTGWGGLPQIFNRYDRTWKAENEGLETLLTNEEFDSARASTPNAHYTDPKVIRFMWNVLEKMGFKGGKALEPSMGVGFFYGLMPDRYLKATRLSGVELDSISGRISKQLYQEADIRVTGYETAKFPNNFFDLIISNVPFGDYKVHDPIYNKYHPSIHNYFFLKSLDKARPGGVVAFITSHYVMDKRDSMIRKLIAEKADLIAAYRLPRETFKDIANTEVVTDIMFLRKRVEGEQNVGPAWVESIEKTKGEDRFYRNEYFDAHSENIFGNESLAGKMYREGEYTVSLEKTGATVEAFLNDALLKVKEISWVKPESAPSTKTEIISSIPAPEHIKMNAFTVVGEKIFQKKMDENGAEFLEPVEVPDKQIAKTKYMIRLRDTARALLHEQMGNENDEALKPLQEKLNKEYDKFFKLFGAIHDRKNKQRLVFAEDPDYPLVLSIENWNETEKMATKGDIFTKRVIQPFKKITKADTAKDALLVGLSETGGINWDRMRELTGKTDQELQSELQSQGIVYRNPEGEKWEMADEYLSGNVREKLKIAEAATQVDPKYQANVEALRAVQPKDLTHDQIEARLGSVWIPPGIVSEFIGDVLNVRLNVGFSPSIAMWTIEKPRNKWSLERAENTEKWGTPYFSGHELVEMALNHKAPTVRIKDEEGKPRVDVQATEAAREKQYQIKEKFKEWVWTNSDRREALVKKYNDEMNNQRMRQFDGSHLTLPGANPQIVNKLWDHQKDGAWRSIQSPTTLLAHTVGAGKTFTMIASAMELKRMGIVKKPMFVVPNHMIEQFSGDVLKFYPSAKVLIPTEKDLSKVKRNTFLGRIATGDWDAVVIPHSSFKDIPMSRDAVVKHLRQQMEDLEAAKMELIASGEDKKRSKIIKEVEKAKKKLAAKIEKLLATEEKTGILNFEELGVDQLFVDEAHYFKNLMFATKMMRIAGVGGGKSAGRASDLYIKTDYLLNKYNRGIVFATGTPVSNTMAEMFTMMRYLQPRDLADYKMNHFDAWAGNFGEVISSWELKPEGEGYRVKSRFARFVNIPELMHLFRKVADVKTAEMLNLPRPGLVGGKPVTVVAPRSPHLEAYIRHLSERAEAVRSGAVDPRIDNMLKISVDGRKASLDMRLVNPIFTSGEESKVKKAADKIAEIYKRTAGERLTQIVMADFGTPKKTTVRVGDLKETDHQLYEALIAQGYTDDQTHKPFNAYDEIKKRLIAQGVRAEEIAFIHDFEKKEQKQSLFDRVNAGEVRVLFGSTDKLGVGTNVQAKLVALHHIDAPWRPTDIEQREGRILRPGNTNQEVEIYRYVTEQSFDTYMWQILESKARFIAQVMTDQIHARTAEDIEGAALTYAEVKALASGNPIVIEKVKVDAEVRRLQMIERQHIGDSARIQDEIAKIEALLPTLEDRVNEFKSDLAKRRIPEKFSIRIEGKEYADRKEAGEAIQKISGRLFLEKQKGMAGTAINFGEYAGLPLSINPGGSYYSGAVGTQTGAIRIQADSNTIFVGESAIAHATESATGTIQSLDYSVNNLEEKLSGVQGMLRSLREDIDAMTAQIEAPFPQAEKLRELEKRQIEINRELGLDKSDLTEALEDEKEKLGGIEEEEGEGTVEVEEEEEYSLVEGARERRRATVEGARRRWLGEGVEFTGLLDRYGVEISGQSVENVQKAIAPFIEKWHLGDKVKVVQSVDDVPESIRSPKMRGVYVRSWDKIVMVADRITDNKDAMELLFHEALGHYGIRQFFGPKINSYLLKAYQHAENQLRAGKNPELARIIVSHRIDLNTTAGKMKAGGEYIAWLAEKGETNIPLMQQIISAIRNILREMGFNVDLTDADIISALAGAARKMEKGTTAATESPGEALYDIVNPLTETASQKESPFDLLKQFKSRHMLGIKDNDLKKMETFYANPWHIGRKYREFRKLIDIEMKREETREQVMHQLLANTVKTSESKIHEFMNLSDQESAKIFKVMVWCDANNEFFTKEADLKAKARELGVGDLNANQVSAYYAWKRTMNRAWDMLMDQAVKMTFRRFEGKPWFDDLKTISMTKKRDLIKNKDKKKQYDQAKERYKKLLPEEKKAFDRAMESVKKPANRIRMLRAQMGRIKYYVPRTREKGKYVIRVYDEVDEVIWSERTNSPFKGKQIESRLKSKFPNHEVRASIEKGIPESVFQQISDASVEKFVERAIERAKNKEEITEEDANALRNALFESVVDQLKERGFGQRMIRRKEGPVIGGYETENGKKVFMDYISGLAGFITKQDAAFDFHKALGAINMQEKTELYQYSSDYVRDMLRNTTEIDRLSGKARSIAFVYYLSGNLRMVGVQFTQNFVTGIPVLGRETKKPQKKYFKAMTDVVFGNLTEEEKRAASHLADRGVTQEQFIKEITGKMEHGLNKTSKRLLDILALPFSGAERFNRRAAALAMFRVARNEQKLSFEESLDKARDFVYDTHFLYGKANLPSWARAATTGAGIARTAYTFRTFQHNYLLLLQRTFRGPDGKIALDVMGRSLAYIFLFAGMAGLPFLDDLLDEWERRFGIPVRKHMREALRGVGGEILEKFGMAGFPALIGVDISGSLKPAGIPKLSLRTASEETLFGVYGGLIDKGTNALDAMSRGDVLRAIEFASPVFIENLFKAARMTKGATTPTGKIMFDEEGRPIELTGPEAVAQATGFRPERMAEISKERRTFSNVEGHYKAKRDDLYAKFRLAASEEERRNILREMERYNLDVMKYQGAIPAISRESLRGTFIQKPEKARLRFEQAQ